jgi:hypothetical protein
VLDKATRLRVERYGAPIYLAISSALFGSVFTAAGFLLFLSEKPKYWLIHFMFLLSGILMLNVRRNLNLLAVKGTKGD